MNERQLLALKYVIQYGTMTKASELLHVTQSAVSQMITNLEQDLGFPVLERRQGKIAPTPQGRSFLTEAGHVLDAMGKARRAAVELRNLSVGNLRIASTPVFALSMLPNVLAQFNKTHPDTTISSQAHHSHEVRELVTSQIFDLGIYELHHPPKEDETEVYSVQCSCVLRQDDPLAGQSVITPEDLADRALVSLYNQHPTTQALRSAFESHKLKWDPSVECNLFAAACQLIKRSGCVSWVDPFTFSMFSDPALCVRPFEPEIMLDFAVLQSRGDQKSPLVAHMADLIREEIKVHAL